ncbi:MAG: metallophosphoesterase [Oligoflexia bacterium]|nr:metallophosphoesterase [Oligoflexia bacterium]
MGALGVVLLFFSFFASAEVNFTVLQTSDLHSHYTNTDSPFQLGGLARVATKIKELKSINENTLVLDAGDFTEGSIFFVDRAGVATYQIMEAIGYDSIVLGNHDWLVGPQELYKSLEASQFSIPILSANLDLSKLDPKVELQKYLKPYIIKNVGGLKIGILGLSTFQFIFDSFFLPVKLLDPVHIAKKYVEQLRDVEKCNVVIVLSHLGYEADRAVAKNVKGIDLIVGGHSHLLFKNLAYESGVPISHVGKWGHYLGEINLAFDKSKVLVKGHKIHEIKPQIQEDHAVGAIISGAIFNIEKKWGKIFSDKILFSQVDLPVKDYRSDNLIGHWVADGYREFTKSDIAFENPSYASRDIFKGYTHTADLFNIFPHIYNPQTDRAWTLKTFLISGLYTKLLVSGIFRAGLYLKMSNARAVLDLSKTVNQLQLLEVNGSPIDPQRMYKVAGTDGIAEAIEFLKLYGIDIGVAQMQDTNVEAWRVAANYIQSKSPITYNKINWEARVRTLQPDVVIRPEEMLSRVINKDITELKFKVRNTGFEQARNIELKVLRAKKPFDTLISRDEKLLEDTEIIKIGSLDSGAFKEFNFNINTKDILPGRYTVSFILNKVEGEFEIENNKLDTYLDLGESF